MTTSMNPKLSLSPTHSSALGDTWRDEIVVRGEGEEWKHFFVFADRMPKVFDLKIHLAARGSRAEIIVAYLGRRGDETDMNITLVHDASDTYGRITAKAALFDEARFTLRGMLEITPRAHGADSYLLAKGLLMSPQARAEIHPHLEILTDEVRASHGSSIGRLDERQLFYLQSRGISRVAAEEIILSGYFRDLAGLMPASYAAKFFQ